MANWTGMARSNYVRVKDPQAFKDFVDCFPAQLIEREKDGEMLYGFYSLDDGMIPALHQHDADDQFMTACSLAGINPDTLDTVDPERVLITEMIHRFLAHGETLIVIEAGNEKARFVGATALAIHYDGGCSQIDLLSDIMRVAKERWGGKPTVPIT